ncbi:MAG: 50S ribosomal protein L34 [Planctomycetota bacterium]|nr:MAG: 50S ribosomal protein L34 [Planctomycetota bacterium]RKY17675.1 MAG: 50S ribosomal protein L34 [Planctomycetota bacterium]
MKVRIRNSRVKQRIKGFLARMKTRSGRKIIRRQRRKGRWKLAS